MSQFFVLIGNILRRYSMGQRVVIIIVFVGIISAIISLMMWANRPEYVVLYSDLDPSNASRMVSELRGLKITYEIENNGKTILVPVENVAEMRLKFAELGFAGHSVAGYEIFDDTKIGMTSFMQRLNMRRALEGELTKTINQFPGVKNSRVHLVFPEGKLFEENNEGSASVVLYLHSGRYINSDQVKGISALVSNSVEGISLENVVIVDAEGKLLSESHGRDEVLGSAGNKWDLRHAVEAKLQRKVADILEGIVGYNNAVVEVSVDLDFQQIERTMETYDPENVVIISEERHSETSTNSDSLQNSNENYERENVITNYEINKTVEHYIGNTGTVQKLSVAVLINGSYKTTQNQAGEEVKEYIPRQQNELTQITALIKSAVGYDAERGDIVEVQNLQFDTNSFLDDRDYFATSEKRAMWASVIDKGLLSLGVLAAFFLLRVLLKSTKTILPLPETRVVGTFQKASASTPTTSTPKLASYAEAEEEDEISEDLFIAKLSPEARAKLKAKDRMTSDVVKYAKEKPQDAAKLIRSWLTEEK